MMSVAFRFRTMAVGLAAFGLFSSHDLLAQRQLEKLGRGVIAVRINTGSVYVGWRMLGNDPGDVGFNLYRVAGGTTNLLNLSPITNSCNFVDATANLAVANSYFVRPVLNAVEQAASAAFVLPANATTNQYLSIPLTPPPDGITPDGVPYSYNANDCSAGDLDGDGEYEIILKWDPTNSKDNSQSGFTGDTFVDAYKLDGTRLWRIDLGPNIRSGAHYLDPMVFDFDADGRAEMMCRTAPGSKDGPGNYVGGIAKWQNANGPHPTFNDTDDYRYNNPNGVTNGYVLAGPEFLTVFNGLTGEELATATYYPKRDQDLNDDNPSASRINTIWGDSTGNRIDRFLAGVAYLDGRRPSAVFCRGYYTRAFLVAWDWRNGQLTKRWVFDSNDGTPGNLDYRGQGAHSLTIGDGDGDGKDEITYGAAAIDDNGKGLYSTLLGHGDALHLSDMDPARPGLEVWMVHESPSSYGPAGLEFRNAKTGALLFGVDGQNADVGRGVAIDIDPRYFGYEMWGSRGGLMSAGGVQITANRPGQMNFAVWWDADLLREILDSTTISKWNWLSTTSSTLLSPGVASNNGTKATPALSADILGDWREEVIWRTSNNSELRIYTTTIVATNRFYTLMHDPQYRVAIAWQNSGYNQPPHPGFYIGPGMYPQPVAPMSEANLVWGGAASMNWDTGITANWFTNRAWMSNYTASVFHSGDTVLFDLGGSNTSPVNFVGAISPSKVTVHAPQDFVFAGSGSLVGAMSLLKVGAGKLTINNTNTYTGPTALTEGALVINGSLDQSRVNVQGGVWGSTLAGVGRLGQGATLMPGSTLSPGASNGIVGTLTASNSLSQLGSVLNAFDLSNDPSGVVHSNDRVNVVGNLVLAGTNTIAINQLDNFLGGGVYTLISYSGTLTGGLSNLVLSGAFVQPVMLTNPPGAIALLAIVPGAPPTAPSGLSATAIGAFQINLVWTDNSTDENGFLIERSAGNTNSFSQIALLSADDTNYADIGLSPNTTYYYRVRGTNIAGAGLFSNIASATTLSPPASLTWRGDGTNIWDLTSTPNWYDGSGIVVFNDGTDVLFDQTGSNNTAITLVGVMQPDSITVNASKSYTWSGTGSIAGATTLIKSGSGGLTISTPNTFAGGVTLNSGTLTLNNPSAAGSGPLILKGGTVSLTGSGGPATYGNAIRVSNTVSVTISGSGNNNQALSGSWVGSNTVNVSIGSGGTFSVQGSMSSFNGTIALGSSAGTFRFFGSSGSSLATFNLGTSTASMVNRDGSATIRLGSLTGGSGTFLRGRSSSSGGSGSNYEIGGKNTNSTFNGQIVNGGDVTRITKVGTGSFTLTSTNSYTGPTAVNAGTLFVNGIQTNATGTVTVAPGATLGGLGTVGGSTIIDGNLAPGSNAVGRLTFATNLLFNAGSAAILEIRRTPFTNDLARVLGGVTYGGTLNVINISPELLQAGDNFRLFDAAGYDGAFADLNLPDLDAGLDWSTNRLTVDGRLWVVKTTSPVISSARISNGKFLMSGTGGTPNWTYYVLGSTNVTTPINQWPRLSTNLFNASGGFSCTNTISPSVPQFFYLLQAE